MAKKLSRGHPSHWLWAHPADSLNTWQRNFTRGHKKFKNEILDLFVIVGLWIKVKPRGRLTSISTKSIRLTSHWIWIRSSIVLNRSWWWTVFYSKLLLRSRALKNDALMQWCIMDRPPMHERLPPMHEHYLLFPDFEQYLNHGYFVCLFQLTHSSTDCCPR